MPRDIPVGNGSLLVCFDFEYQLRDLYSPCVGKENHACCHPFRLGFWVEGAFSWMGPEWDREMRYLSFGAWVGHSARIDQYSTGIKEFKGNEGTWRDADDVRIVRTMEAVRERLRIREGTGGGCPLRRRPLPSCDAVDAGESPVHLHPLAGPV